MPEDEKRRRIVRNVEREVSWLKGRCEELKRNWAAKEAEDRIPRCTTIAEFIRQLDNIQLFVNVLIKVYDKTNMARFRDTHARADYEKLTRYIDKEMRNAFIPGLRQYREIYSIILMTYYEAISNIELTTTTEPFTRLAHSPHVYSPALSAMNRLMKDFCGKRGNSNIWNGIIITLHGEDVKVYHGISLMGIPGYYLLYKSPRIGSIIAHEAAHFLYCRKLHSQPITKQFLNDSLNPMIVRFLLDEHNPSRMFYLKKLEYVRNTGRNISMELLSDWIALLMAGPTYLVQLTRHLLFSPFSALIDPKRCILNGYPSHYDRVYSCIRIAERLAEKGYWLNSWITEMKNDKWIKYALERRKELDWKLNIGDDILSQITRFGIKTVNNYKTNFVPSGSNAEKVEKLCQGLGERISRGELFQIKGIKPRHIMASIYYATKKGKKAQRWKEYVPFWVQALSISMV